MGVCTEVKRTYEEEVQIPVEQSLTTATQTCTEHRRRVEKEVRKPVEEWISRQERKCKKRKWYDPRRWICTLVNVVVRVVTWVIVLVVEWVPYLVCKVVTNVIKIIVMVIVRVVKFVVTFTVCLFTDPLEALKSFRDLWTDLLDVVEDIVEFLKSFLDDTIDLLTDVERLNDSLSCNFGGGGRFVGGIGTWVISRSRELAEVVYEIINSALRLILGGLNLNWCRAADGALGVGADVLKGVVWVLSIPFGSGGGIRDQIRRGDLEKTVEDAIQRATDDEDLREKARDRVGLGGCPFGLTFTLEPCRFFISSRSKEIDLRELHSSGALDLYGLAGLMSGCEGPSALWEKEKIGGRWRAEVVYVGTTTPVSYRDLDLYLSEGPNAVAEFRIYAMPLSVFERYLKLAKRKAYSIGIDFVWDRVRDCEWEPIVSTDPIRIPDSGVGQSVLFPKYGRLTAGDDICTIPVLAGFGYVGNNKRRGFTSMFPSVVTNVRSSGVTFRDSIPEFLFRWVLIHELGHYFSLRHAGHDGLGHIMFTPDPAANLDTWTWESAVEFFLSGEPQFTRDDAFQVWNWIISNARDCLFGEVPPSPTPVVL